MNRSTVWKYKRHRPWRKFKHKHPVSAVAISDIMTFSGDVQGKIKVWHQLSGSLIKVIHMNARKICMTKFLMLDSQTSIINN